MVTKDAVIEHMKKLDDYDFWVAMSVFLMIDLDMVKAMLSEEQVEKITKRATQEALEEESNEQ